MRRVLLVAYYFPPIGGIGSIRLARFADCLAEYGWEATVLAPGDTPHAPDTGLGLPANVVRSRSLELSRVGRRLGRGDTSGESAGPDSRTGGWRAALRRAGGRAVYPDAQIGWYPGAVAAGLRLMRQKRFDAVFSSSNPLTAHLVAQTLSRRSRTPWVAEYRDPWSDRLPPDHPHRRRAETREQGIAEAAAAVVMPTPTWAAHYGGLWGTDVAVLPNGHDGVPREPLGSLPTIVHLGTYYPGLQTLAPLWWALREYAKGPELTTPRVRFVGDLPAAAKAEAEAAGVGDLVEATGFIPHREALLELARSSILIASGFTGDHPATVGWVPAKLWEYLASDRPILFLGAETSDAGRLLVGQPGCHVVAPEDTAELLDALRAALPSGRRFEREVANFTRQARAGELAEILERAAPRRAA